MELTERQAVELSIELWEWLAETGREKEAWPAWKKNGGEFSSPRLLCFLCEYARYNPFIISPSCELCPYFIKYKASCYEDNRPYSEWDGIKDEDIRKKYAKQFLKELKALLPEDKMATPMEEFIKALKQWLEGFINDLVDCECPSCGRMLNLPDSEDIEKWLKGEK